MTRLGLLALLSHWRRNWLQALTVIAGLALATALWSGVQAINAEAKASYAAASATLGDGQFDMLMPRDGDGIAISDYIALRRAGWQVSPVLEAPWQGMTLVGVDPLTSPSVALLMGDGTSQGLADVLNQAILFANRDTARALASVDEVIIRDSIAPGLVLADIAAVQYRLGRKDLSRLVVLPDQPLSRPSLEDIAPNLQLQASTQRADVGTLTDSFHLNLTAFGLLSFAVGLFIVHAAIGLAFEQRRAMVRTLRALGMPLRALVVLMMGEMLLLAVVSGALGVALGYLIAASLLPDVAATLRGLYGADVSNQLQMRAEWWASGLGMAVLGTAVASGLYLWQTAQMPLLNAAQSQAWGQSARRLRLRQGAVGIGLLIVALALAVWGTGLVAAFAVLAGLLLGGALVLPAATDAVLRWLSDRAKTASGQWFWADTRGQLPGLSLALMALLLALSANIGVATMVSSFRLTFVAFLDQRLAPELYLRVDTIEKSAALLTWTEARGIETLPLWARETVLAGQPSELFGIRVAPTYRQNWTLLSGDGSAWDAVAAGQGTIVNEQLARRAGLSLGEQLSVGPATSVPIVGIVGDYGNPLGQAVIAEILYADIHPDDVALQFGLRSNDVVELRKSLREDLGLSESAMINQDALKAFSLSVFERTFVVTAALNVLTLTVACFALLMSLLTLSDQRLPQLAPAWALGFTRKRLAALELVRAVALALVVSVLAVPVGLGLAWVLLSVVNAEAFGWRLPMFFFPGIYLRLVLLALVAAAIAAAWPAWRLRRLPPIQLLRVFANAR
ncbi:MAG: FtsX-like permease family protein [Marinovum sp.]|nr:FtsX-like permease family protein [Marinovum sp.]